MHRVPASDGDGRARSHSDFAPSACRNSKVLINTLCSGGAFYTDGGNDPENTFLDMAKFQTGRHRA